MFTVMNKTHIVFLAADGFYALDSLMTIASVSRYPAVKYKSRFRSKAILSPLAKSLGQDIIIKDHKFDMLYDTKLDLMLRTEDPVQFNFDMLSQTFSNSNLSLYQIDFAYSHFVITNLLTGHKQNVSLENYSSYNYMAQFDPAWKNVVRVSKQNIKEYTAYLLDDIENIDLP